MTAAPQFAVVTTSPAGISGIAITYAQNGVTVTDPTHPGDYTVTATLNNPYDTAPPGNGHPRDRPGDAHDHLGRSRERHRRHRAFVNAARRDCLVRRRPALRRR